MQWYKMYRMYKTYHSFDLTLHTDDLEHRRHRLERVRRREVLRVRLVDRGALFRRDATKLDQAVDARADERVRPRAQRVLNADRLLDWDQGANFHAERRQPLRERGPDVGLAAVRAPACHHLLHEVLEHVVLREQPPRAVVEVLVEHDRAAGFQSRDRALQEVARTGDEREHPARPQAVCIAAGQGA